VGQSALLQRYEQALAARGVLGAQVLLGTTMSRPGIAT
jgi:glutamate 5-kinase